MLERAITVNFDRDLRWIISSVTPMLPSSIAVKFDSDLRWRIPPVTAVLSERPSTLSVLLVFR